MLSGRRPLWRVTRYSPLGSMALLPWLFSLTMLQRLPGGLVELEALAEPLPLADRGRAAGSRYWLGKERGGQDSLSHSGARSIRAAAA
jgi:hypothetical protein